MGVPPAPTGADAMFADGTLDARILVVDDEAANVRVLERILVRAGYTRVRATTDPREALEIHWELDPDLLLLDLRMPGMDGFTVMERIQARVSPGTYFPILVLTGDLDEEARDRALSTGARDFVTKPFELTEVLLRIGNLLETRFLHEALRRHNETLEDQVRERTRELSAAHREILHRLALAAEFRDDATGKHAERVGVMASLIAREMELPSESVGLIRRAATLHDVGKIGIPDAILLKPGPLDPDEFRVMRSHTRIGARILDGSGFPLLEMAREIALTHHEKWDGSGYAGLTEEGIPLVGRIVALADAFDALTHPRPYRNAASPEDAADILQGDSGAHFDPSVVKAFLRVFRSGRIAEWEGFRDRGGWRDPPVSPS